MYTGGFRAGKKMDKEKVREKRWIWGTSQRKETKTKNNGNAQRKNCRRGGQCQRGSLHVYMNFAPFQYLFNYPLRGRLKVIVYEKSCVSGLPIMSTKRIFALPETLNAKSHASVFLRRDCRSCVQLVYERLKF